MEIQPIAKILEIPEEDFPLMVLSDDARGFLGWGIRAHQDGWYNHFMWAKARGMFISQDFPVLHRVSMSKYMKQHRLKLWWNPKWTELEKKAISDALCSAVRLPWYKRLYDVPQIIGFLFKAKWLQIPGRTKICSDHADFLSIVDPGWEIKRHHSPPELNRIFEESDKYEVYGRYSAEGET